MSHGKEVASYRGYYYLEKNGKRVWRSLGTPDKTIAEKRIREFALQAQREQEGLIQPRSEREAATKGLGLLIEDYKNDLKVLGRARKHIHDTVRRIRRIISETGWGNIGDIRADKFLLWRATLKCSAKTNKEYQVSLNAFLNWLVDSEQLTRNPLARVAAVETRGKQVREYRAFNAEELTRLFANAGERRLAYQTLLYTGQRKSEVNALVWDDLHLDSDKPYILFREGTIKDKEKRAVALRREIAEELRAIRPVNFDPSARVFTRPWSRHNILLGDLERAGIERKDGLRRVVHFHSFRKTFQTLGVRCGMNQRAAQAILGHSDANLTARVYTDVASLELHDEIAKLPWISPEGSGAQHGAQNTGVSVPEVSLADTCAKFIEAVKVYDLERVSYALASAVTSGHNEKLGAGAGFEPATFRL